MMRVLTNNAPFFPLAPASAGERNSCEVPLC